LKLLRKQSKRSKQAMAMGKAHGLHVAFGRLGNCDAGIVRANFVTLTASGAWTLLATVYVSAMWIECATLPLSLRKG
jgi:hypothetical protein